MKIVFVIPFLLIGFTISIYSQTQYTERVLTRFIENNKPVSLEMVVFKPDDVGKGPFPTLIYNHGSTGRGDNPILFKITKVNQSIAYFFNRLGWLVVFPQRRGRGQSDGIYDEGFNKDRSGYSHSPKISLLGLERALDDIDEVVKYLKINPLVESDKMLIGGESRGGLLSIVYAGTRPDVFIGAINFVGGWIAEDPKSWFLRLFYNYSKEVNTESFKRGATFARPTIWLYGENDRFYSIEHAESNFKAFISAGGIGTFHRYNLGKGIEGHFLPGYANLWWDDLEEYINKLEISY